MGERDNSGIIFPKRDPNDALEAEMRGMTSSFDEFDKRQAEAVARGIKDHPYDGDTEARIRRENEMKHLGDVLSQAKSLYEIMHIIYTFVSTITVERGEKGYSEYSKNFLLTSIIEKIDEKTFLLKWKSKVVSKRLEMHIMQKLKN